MTNITEKISKIYSLLEEYFTIVKEYVDINDIDENELLEFYNTTGLLSITTFLSKNKTSNKIVGGNKGDWKKNKTKTGLTYYENIKTGEIKILLK